jgi:hypothetical protein
MTYSLVNIQSCSASQIEYFIFQSYVHVSTAYSHCVNSIIEEIVPRMNFNYQEMLDYIESKTDDELIEETPR